MKINIQWLEKKHIDSLKKDVLDINGTDEQGNPVKFAVWQDFPGFEGIMNGGVIEGNLWEKPGTGKFTLYPPKDPATVKSGASGGGFKAGMQKMVTEKNENIKAAQETKHEAIREAGAQRDAVLMVTTFYPEFNDATIASEKERLLKEKYLYWREFFLNQPPF